MVLILPCNYFSYAMFSFHINILDWEIEFGRLKMHTFVISCVYPRMPFLESQNQLEPQIRKSVKMYTDQKHKYETIHLYYEIKNHH